jgi:hypothetical protein
MGCSVAPGVADSAARGSLVVNSLPFSGPLLVAVAVPPCISTSPLTTVSPIPRPPSLRASERSPFEANLFGCVSIEFSRADLGTG